VDNENNTPFEVVSLIDQQTEREIITINLKTALTVGKKYKISMKFVSILNDELRGFYRSTYEENGVTK
jgi:aminopeptidase N